MPEPSILDTRLAEIDRRLRLIQSGLVPVGDDDGPVDEPSADPLDPGNRGAVAPTPLHVARGAPGADGDVATLTAKLCELTAVHERLLATTQDLLREHADLLSRVAPTLGVSAGPFTDTETLHEFQSALAELPQVREVLIREYAGAERAVLDVHLWTPIS